MSGFPFGSSSSATAFQSSSAFGFSNPSSSPSPSTGFSLGSSAASSGFSFGSSAAPAYSSSPAPALSFSFSTSPLSASANPTSSFASSASLFGFASLASSSSLFGSTSASSSPFGPTTASSASASPMFGSASPAASASSPVFGSALSSAAPSISASSSLLLFGTSSPFYVSAVSSGSSASSALFGTPASSSPAPSSGSALFGAPLSASSASSTLFGIASSSASSATSLFGSSTASSNLFGSTSSSSTSSAANSTSAAPFAGSSSTGGFTFKNIAPTASAPPATSAPLAAASTPDQSTAVVPSIGVSTLTSAPVAVSSSSTTASQTSSSLVVASSSGTTSSVGVAVSTTPKLPSEITWKTVEEIIKEWNSELQERTGKFRKQANAIAEWDRRILHNRDVLLRLEIEAAKVVETQANLERQLELIEMHQQEVDKAFQSMEEEAEHVYKDEHGILLDDEAASTRDAMYEQAEFIEREMEQMTEQIKSIIQTLNANQGGELEANDAMTLLDAVVKILNNHLSSLMWTDEKVETVASAETSESALEGQVGEVAAANATATISAKQIVEESSTVETAPCSAGGSGEVPATTTDLLPADGVSDQAPTSAVDPTFAGQAPAVAIDRASADQSVAPSTGVGTSEPVPLTEHATGSGSSPPVIDLASPLVDLVTQLVSKGDDLVGGLRAVASSILAREAELKKLMAGKDALIAETNAALSEKDVVIAAKDAALAKVNSVVAERDDMIDKLEALVASSARQEELGLLQSQLSSAKAEKELERRKALYYKVQLAAAIAAKQCVQNQIQSDSELIKDLQSALYIARNSAESTLAHEKTAADQNLKVQKSESFRIGFEEGSRPANERSIKSPEDYDEQIGLYDNIDPLLDGSPDFDPDNFFATSDSPQ